MNRICSISIFYLTEASIELHQLHATECIHTVRLCVISLASKIAKAQSRTSGRESALVPE